MVIDATLLSCEVDILCACGEHILAWGRDDGTITGTCNCGNYYVVGTFDLFLHQLALVSKEDTDEILV